MAASKARRQRIAGIFFSLILFHFHLIISPRLNYSSFFFFLLLFRRTWKDIEDIDAAMHNNNKKKTETWEHQERIVMHLLSRTFCLIGNGNGNNTILYWTLTDSHFILFVLFDAAVAFVSSFSFNLFIATAIHSQPPTEEQK